MKGAESDKTNSDADVPTQKALRATIKLASKEGDVSLLTNTLRDMAKFHDPLSHQSVRYYARKHEKEMVLKQTNGKNYHTLK